MPFIEFQHTKIYYRLEGKGNPVLLIHGFAEDGNVWNKQVDALKDKNLLIIPDLPGSGSSDIIDGHASIERFADAMKAVVDSVILKNKEVPFSQLAVIGHSMGGYITLAFAEKYPEMLNSFGLFHSSAFADSKEKIAIRKKAIEFISRNGTEAFLKTSVPNLFCEETKKENPGLIDLVFEMANTISPEVLIQYYQAMIERPDRTSVLKSFKKPVLLIAGKFDTAVPLQASLEQFTMPPISTVHILKHSGHMGMWEEVQLSNSFLRDFLPKL